MDRTRNERVALSDMRPLLLIAVFGIIACDDGGTGCCVDRDSFAVVEATVLGSSSFPVVSAVVSAFGHGAVASEGEGVTDDDGWVRLGLAAGLGAPGLYSVSLVVTPAGQEVADTLGPYEVEFYSAFTPPDTTRLTVAITH